MLDLHYIREHTDEVRKTLARRNTVVPLDRILELDQQRRQLIGEVETLKKSRNENSRQIGGIMKAGGDATPLKEETKRIGVQISGLDEQKLAVETELHDTLLQLPNLIHASVPEGCSEEDNPVVRSWGEPPEEGAGAPVVIQVFDKKGAVATGLVNRKVPAKYA
jgi:seryl-tRNA synthetase